MRLRYPTYLVPQNGKWLKIFDRELCELETSDKSKYNELDDLITRYQINPLSFILPHGRPRKDKDLNDGLAFLNDYKAELLLLIAPNKVGKTYIGAAKAGLCAGPCDKDWECFKTHGVKHNEWMGPSEGIIASFTWDNVAVLWRTYQKLWPREWLGPYSPRWGEFPGEKGKAKYPLSFGDGKPKTITLPCEVTLTMLCDSQLDVHWESRMADWGHMDEQLSEDKADILLTRFQTSPYDYNPVICTLTPFVVDGRPDTGANGWLKKKVVDGKSPKGRKFAEYVITMDSVPEEIVSAKKKHEAFVRNVEEPVRLQDDRKIRQGRAKYYAEWEVGGGGVISAWNPDIHIIQPFDVTKYKPTLYRMIDHGENPCAALLMALMPWGDAICYKEYYEYGNSIAKNCKQIVEELCGNERRISTDFEFEGQTWDVYEEVQTNMEFMASELDARSYGAKMRESGRTLGMAYNDNGCECVPADGRQGHTQDNQGAIDLMCQMFELDPKRIHINKRLGKKSPKICEKAGAPRVYLFDTLINFKSEIDGWTRNPKTGKPLDKNDHLVSCAKFYAARPRDYFGDNTEDQVESDQPLRKRSDYTGY